MSKAIAELQTAAEIAEHNAPIHEREGRSEQAALCRQRAAECRAAARNLQE